MKRLLTSIVLITLTISFSAQVPQKISYQAVIRNSSGQLVANHAVGMRISILQGTATGTAVYVETQTPTTNTNGLATIEIGSGTVVSGSFTGINWATGVYFIKTETDPAGGTNYTITGTSQILSVPYALYARTAASVVDAVTLSGDQTITGSKTFTKDILVNGLTVGKGGGGVSTNTALGISALKSNTTGPNNTSLGSESLFKNSTGYSNTSVGYRSLYSSTTGWRNTAIGDSALFSNTSGSDNTAIGVYALHLNTSGYWNTGNGYQSLVSNTTGIGNTAIGYKAFRSGKTGNYNTAVGYHAGSSNAVGSSNVFIGSSAGYYETGSNMLFIDNQHRANEADARAKALIYGVFDADPANQVLTINGEIIVNNHKITNVANPVNAQDAVTKAYVDAILSNLSATGAILADVDGNIYSTVRLGSQVWMAENLKTTKYKNGANIPLVTDNAAWSNLTTPGYCWNNNNVANKDIYGALYNWYTVNTGNLCPAGWHVPTDAEWTTLENYLIANGYNYDGTITDDKIAKALASTTLWTSSSVPGAVGNTDYPAKRNATGFTALPGGRRSYDGTFGLIGLDGYWWSATGGATTAYRRNLYYNVSYVFGNFGDNESGFSVRCLRD